MSSGDLFILSAPSGAGKTTLIQRMFDQERTDGARMVFSVSHTTRAPRMGEVEGRDYYFVDRAAFQALVAADGFLEWAEVHGNLYGTSRQAVEERLESGVDVMLDIDVQGAEQVLARRPDAVSIFVLPPSYEALRERLTRRGLDSEEVIARRLAVSLSEIECYERYQYVIVNADVDKASAALAAIVVEKRHRLARMRDRVESVMEAFGGKIPP